MVLAIKIDFMGLRTIFGYAGA